MKNCTFEHLGFLTTEQKNASVFLPCHLVYLVYLVHLVLSQPESKKPDITGVCIPDLVSDYSQTLVRNMELFPEPDGDRSVLEDSARIEHCYQSSVTGVELYLR